MPEIPAHLRPWQVHQIEPTNFVEGYMVEAEAFASCDDRNKRAEEMGIQARYMVVEFTK